MSLKPQPIDTVPEDTARFARMAYPNGNIYLQLRDEFGTIYEDTQFMELYPQRGQPAEAPWRLALVSVMQFREGLSDRQAAEAVRGRLDWKYLLGLGLGDPGFHHSVLVEFRQRLLAHTNESLLFDLFLTRITGTRVSQTAWTTTYRLNSCAGQDPFARVAWRGLEKPFGPS